MTRHAAEDDNRGDPDEIRSPDAGDVESRVTDVGEAAEEDERVAQLLEHTIDVPVLADAVERQLPADAADTLESLEDEEVVELLGEMEDQAAANALTEMLPPLAVTALQDLTQEDTEYARRLLQLMAPDDAADLLQELGEDDRRRLLEGLPGDEASELAALIQYDRESAGGIMTTDVLALREAMTVAEAIDHIRGSEAPDHARYAFVVDAEDHLRGVIGLHRLLLARTGEVVGELMRGDVRAVRPDVDREAVAREFDRYDYVSLPVVDDEGCLLGQVTVDDVIDIIRAEQTEDVQRAVGAGAGEGVYSGLLEKFRGRVRWLVLSLFMMCLAAFVVLAFEELIQDYTILAWLLPISAAVVGNAGHQALAVSLRGIVLDEVRRDRVIPLLTREGVVGLLNGLMLGLLVFVIVALAEQLEWSDSASWSIGIVAGVALAISMAVGTTAGSAIPLVMRRFGADPAQSSAIFLIMITDLVSFSILLLLTWVLLPMPRPS